MMNVLQVVASVAPAAGGTSEAVLGLCRVLGQEGLCISLHVLQPTAGSPRGDYRIFAHEQSPLFGRLGASRAMLRALTAAAREAEICHTAGVWLMPNVYPAWAARGTSCRVVVSPRGMLEPWALKRSALRKKAVWYLWQKKALREAACFHATAESECRSIRRLGFRQPVAIVPNGVNVPETLPAADNDGESANRAGRPRRLLFFGRLHPKKGIDALIEAWRATQNEFPDWELHVVGPDEGGYGTKMQRMAREIGAERVIFAAPVWGDDRWPVYREADLFVLPTHSENFGIAVAEALAHGVPAIVTRGAPWAGLETNQCGWWIEPGAAVLAECLRDAMSLSRCALRQRGARGREWMLREMSWKRVGSMMRETYAWLLGGGAPPPFVQRN